MNTINLKKLEEPEDIIKAFDLLNKRAKEIGCPIALDTQTSTPLTLYYHEDYPNRILVDKATSSLRYRCPRCGNILGPSDVKGYTYVCEDCDENFFQMEIDEQNPVK